MAQDAEANKMNTGQLILNHLLLGLGTYFWLWYLTYEGNRYKGGSKKKDSPPKWYEREIFPKRDKSQ